MSLFRSVLDVVVEPLISSSSRGVTCVDGRRSPRAQPCPRKCEVSRSSRRMWPTTYLNIPPLGLYPNLRSTPCTVRSILTASMRSSSRNRRDVRGEPALARGRWDASIPSRRMCARKTSYFPGPIPSRTWTSLSVRLAATAAISCSSVHLRGRGMIPTLSKLCSKGSRRSRAVHKQCWVQGSAGVSVASSVGARIRHASRISSSSCCRSTRSSRSITSGQPS
jgi:hypothetical protein